MDINDKVKKIQSKSSNAYNLKKQVIKEYTPFCLSLGEEDSGEAYLLLLEAIQKWDSDITPSFDDFVKGYIKGGLRLSKKKEEWDGWNKKSIEGFDVEDNTQEDIVRCIDIPGGYLTDNEKTWFQMKMDGYYDGEISKHLTYNSYQHVREFDEIAKSTIEKLKKLNRYMK